MSIDLQTLEGDRLRGLARRMLGAGPSLCRLAPEPFADQLGWTLLEGAATTFLADAGLGIGGRAMLTVGADGLVRQAMTTVTSLLPRPVTEEGREALQDAYALAGRALIAELGPPAASEPGDEPALEWRDGEASLGLRRGRNLASLSLWRTADLEGLE